MQIYMQDVPWDPNGEKEAWMDADDDMCHVKFDMEAGVNLIFDLDHFKIMPYGPETHTIATSDMCAWDVAPGYTMRWKYDHMLHYQYKNRKRAFMVVRLPTEQIPTDLHPMSNAIEAVMRDRFRISKSSDLTTPCWFPSSQVERERDYYKTMYEDKKRAYDTLYSDYMDLDKRTALMEANFDKCETKLQFHKDALDTIDKALVCAICMERFDSTGHCMMPSCGHVIHTACQEQQTEKGELKCATCRAPVRYWQDFFGFTAISAAITTLRTDMDKVDAATLTETFSFF